MESCSLLHCSKALQVDICSCFRHAWPDWGLNIMEEVYTNKSAELSNPHKLKAISRQLEAIPIYLIFFFLTSIFLSLSFLCLLSRVPFHFSSIYYHMVRRQSKKEKVTYCLFKWKFVTERCSFLRLILKPHLMDPVGADWAIQTVPKFVLYRLTGKSQRSIDQYLWSEHGIYWPALMWNGRFCSRRHTAALSSFPALLTRLIGTNKRRSTSLKNIHQLTL